MLQVVPAQQLFARPRLRLVYDAPWNGSQRSDFDPRSERDLRPQLSRGKNLESQLAAVVRQAFSGTRQPGGLRGEFTDRPAS